MYTANFTTFSALGRKGFTMDVHVFVFHQGTPIRVYERLVSCAVPFNRHDWETTVEVAEACECMFLDLSVGLEMARSDFRPLARYIDKMVNDWDREYVSTTFSDALYTTAFLNTTSLDF
jgi:hypothetical protein